MKKTPLDKKKWENWIKENEPELKNISKKVFYKMRRSKVNLSGTDFFIFDSDDIYQECIAVLFENQERALEIIKEPARYQKWLISFFWQRLQDKSRKKEGNQDIYKDKGKLFFRHIMNVLGNCEVFIKNRTKFQGVTFSLTSQEPQTIFSLEDLLDIPYPDKIPSNFEQLNNAKNIEKLAIYFWNQSIEITKDKNINISISDFMQWITQYVSINTHVQREADIIDSDKNQHSLMDRYQKNYQSIEEIKIKRITATADSFFHSLNEVDKPIFYYYECKGLTHKEVSEIMNKKSNMSYRREQVREKLKNFLRPLDDISPGIDESLLAFDFFMEQLCNNLYESIS